MKLLLSMWMIVVVAGCATSQAYGPRTQAIIDHESNLTYQDQLRNEMYYKARYGALCENAGYRRDSSQYMACLKEFYRKDLEARLSEAMALDNLASQYRSNVFWGRTLGILQEDQNYYNNSPAPITGQVCEYADGIRVCSKY